LQIDAPGGADSGFVQFLLERNIGFSHGLFRVLFLTGKEILQLFATGLLIWSK